MHASSSEPWGVPVGSPQASIIRLDTHAIPSTSGPTKKRVERSIPHEGFNGGKGGAQPAARTSLATSRTSITSDISRARRPWGSGTEVSLPVTREESADGLVSLNSLLDQYCSRQARVPILALSNNPRLCDPRLFQNRSSQSYVVIKRLVDLVVALTFGLLCLPFLPLIALAIKLESTGPVVFAQTRVGRYGREFTMYKLRSMTHMAAPSGPLMTTLPNDPRVTRVGKLMRKTRIDEIPQLWNVIRGDMSLIGPRPELPSSSDYLSEIFPGFELRTLAKPGVTGWAQVTIGYADSLEKHQRRLEHDLYYVRSATFSRDFEVARRTLRVMITSKGH